ncbi:MAG: hypothetical protein AB8B61_05120 [Cyclobacteriaceae bacterium]
MNLRFQLSDSRSNIGWALFLILQLGIYFTFSTYIPREQAGLTVAVFVLLFVCYFYVLHRVGVFKSTSVKEKHSLFRLLFVFTILFRAILLFHIPWLSDDFYRFIWDGNLSYQGLNPFMYPPNQIVTEDFFTTPFSIELLNSPQFYTVYPPFGQLVFWLANFASGGNWRIATFILQFITFCCEVGTLLLLVQILKKLELNVNKVFIYALNPLVIVEFTGNTHSEGFMIFFTCLAIYWLVKQQNIRSSIAFGLAVCSKLIPLLILPAFIQFLGFKKTIVYGLVTMSVVVLSFIPFWTPEFILNFLSSLKLYFNYLEFNASFYYLFKWASYEVNEYSLIILKVIFLLIIGVIVLVNKVKSIKQVLLTALWMTTAYLLSSQSVHPWYICFPLFFSLFTNYRFPIVWTFFSVFTYLTYGNPEMQQVQAVMWVEYPIVIGVMLYEVVFRKRSSVGVA